jgi:hypothetical protein
MFYTDVFIFETALSGAEQEGRKSSVNQAKRGEGGRGKRRKAIAESCICMAKANLCTA